LEFADLVAKRTTCRDQVVGWFAGALTTGDFLGVRVSSCFPFVERLDHCATLPVEPLGGIDDGTQRAQVPAPAHALAEHVDLLAQHADIVHDLVSDQSFGLPSANDRKPQLRFTSNLV